MLFAISIDAFQIQLILLHLFCDKKQSLLEEKSSSIDWFLIDGLNGCLLSRTRQHAEHLIDFLKSFFQSR